eukprot:575765-Pyramimonas_sp.AAC.2
MPRTKHFKKTGRARPKQPKARLGFYSDWSCINYLQIKLLRFKTGQADCCRALISPSELVPQY